MKGIFVLGEFLNVDFKDNNAGLIEAFLSDFVYFRRKYWSRKTGSLDAVIFYNNLKSGAFIRHL